MQRTKDPQQVAFLTLQHFREWVLLTYFKDQQLLRAMARRFPETAHARLTERLTLSADTWQGVVDSLNERSGRERCACATTCAPTSRASRVKSPRLSARLTESLSNLYLLQGVRERALQRYRDYAQQLSAMLESADTQVRRDLELQVADLEASMYANMTETIATARANANRLEVADTALDEHLTLLNEIDRKLHWAALGQREPGVLGINWARPVLSLASCSVRPRRRTRRWRACRPPTVRPLRSATAWR